MSFDSDSRARARCTRPRRAGPSCEQHDAEILLNGQADKQTRCLERPPDAKSSASLGGDPTHVASIERDRPAAEGKLAHEQREQRALTGAVGPDHRHHRALGDSHSHAVHSADAAEVALDVTQIEHGWSVRAQLAPLQPAALVRTPRTIELPHRTSPTAAPVRLPRPDAPTPRGAISTTTSSTTPSINRVFVVRRPT